MAAEDQSKDALEADLEAWGAPEAVKSEVLGRELGYTPVYPENWPAWQLFMLVQTQWRMAFTPHGATYTGLDYTAVKHAAGMAGMAVEKETFEKLRIIEFEVLRSLNR